MPRILLVRHGPPARVPAGRLPDAATFARWCAGYDAAGLAAGSVPPAGLVALAARGVLVVSSDLPRAAASAALLAPGRPCPTSSLLREAGLGTPPWPRARLPLAAWLAAARLGWWLGAWPGPEPRPAALVRAGEAAVWLAGLARAHGTVVAVTHGAVRPAVAVALRAGGWRGRAWGRYAPWSAWTFAAPAPGAGAWPSARAGRGAAHRGVADDAVRGAEVNTPVRFPAGGTPPRP